MGAAILAGTWLCGTDAVAAASYGFTIGGFSEGASLSISFDGADLDGDGILYGYFPTDCMCSGPPTEISSLGIAFTGNSLVAAFTYVATDIVGGLGSLTFGEFDAYSLYYVLDPNGTGAVLDGVPPGTIAGDADLSLFATIAGGSVAAIGADCNAFASGPYFGDGVTCAVLNRVSGEDSFERDIATIPEPASLALLGAGLGLLAAARRRMRAV